MKKKTGPNRQSRKVFAKLAFNTFLEGGVPRYFVHVLLFFCTCAKHIKASVRNPGLNSDGGARQSGDGIPEKREEEKEERKRR